MPTTRGAYEPRSSNELHVSSSNFQYIPTNMVKTCLNVWDLHRNVWEWYGMYVKPWVGMSFFDFHLPGTLFWVLGCHVMTIPYHPILVFRGFLGGGFPDFSFFFSKCINRHRLCMGCAQGRVGTRPMRRFPAQLKSAQSGDMSHFLIP